MRWCPLSRFVKIERLGHIQVDITITPKEGVYYGWLSRMVSYVEIIGHAIDMIENSFKGINQRARSDAKS